MSYMDCGGWNNGLIVRNDRGDVIREINHCSWTIDYNTVYECLNMDATKVLWCYVLRQGDQVEAILPKHNKEEV
ncbi:hypothetical protein [Vibrio phage JSF13]|jgi:hypothetical protein|uniref:Uncharacterized protein ORF199 n=1 Tax=Vibrio phage ICP1 TaxID=979525 RepID=F1D1M3_9CAUD|nr:hypothetical protein ViPhICP1_gp201 [Vibrio phage ICP1]ADX88693.1 hypothetical protein TUST1-159_00965 [Vibrio phage ICP1_2006_B]ADX88919.1 hypothetical protein TUST1-17_00965 [Vibrio phage ICP1_2006_A]ADX89149.1 hypothetical protein TUST1-15_00985 [Vibrio phage ICP1_2005_A]ADX89379.1 hypothetical protein TUST1-2_00995 [Vibrio phage ICP1_2001_A]APD17943.1 hypothetical protein [Vibrio phage JSF4]ASV41515.1 hypothetical protein [Vibrio phage JSF6]ASV41751.1 hypothetical protein [Vibrio phag